METRLAKMQAVRKSLRRNVMWQQLQDGQYSAIHLKNAIAVTFDSYMSYAAVRAVFQDGHK